jgi:histidine triad (HIT) family protein
VPPDPDCLFCKLYADGDHVAATDGFVAIRDIHPQAETHLLVIPEHHIASFHEIARYDADEDKRMLDFVADVAARSGLTDYRVVVNAGAGAGQTIFHLHLYILGGSGIGRMA